MTSIGYIYMISGCPGIYVGQTVDPTRRERKHRHHLENGNHKNIPLQRAVFEHGYSAFAFLVIQEDVPIEELDTVEQQWICAIGTFNMIPAGGPSFRGRTHSEETKRKLRNMRHTEESKAKMRQAKLGIPRPPHTEEHKERIRQALLGKPHTEDRKANKRLKAREAAATKTLNSQD